MERSGPSSPSSPTGRGGDRARLAAALLIWALASAAAFAFVARHATQLAFLDDLAVVESLRPDRPVTAGLLWTHHNEHRIPLARLIHLALVRTTDSFRATALANVGLLAAVALGLVLAARRARGRSRVSDAAIPLLLLHLGHAENLLNAFQVVLIVPLALLSAVLVLIALRPGPPGVRRTLALVGCMLLLALCGLPGVTPLPALMLWLAWIGLRAPERDSLALRRAGAFGLAGSVLVAALLGLVFLGFEFLPGTARAGPGKALLVAGQVLAQCLGAVGRQWWPWSLGAVLALAAAAAGLLLRAAAREPAEGPRALGLVAFLCAILTVALAIGWGRGEDQPGAGFLSRYGHLSAPLACGAYLAFAVSERSRAARVLQPALLLLASAAYLLNVQPGLAMGRERVDAAEAFVRDLDDGVPLRDLAERHWRAFYYGERVFLEILQHLGAAGLPPFHDASRRSALRAGRRHPMFAVEPLEVRAARPAAPTRIGGVEVLLLYPPGEVRFALDGSESRASGCFGIHPRVLREGGSDGVVFAVELLPRSGAPTLLFERRLLPSEAAARQLHGFEVDLPQGAEGELVLRTANEPGFHDHMDWAFWALVDLR